MVFHKFVLLHKNNKSDLFCFYEGKDTQYYFPRINTTEENHHPIVCGNKKSVLDSYKLIKEKYQSFRTKFFVDSDFDDPIYLADLYVTPGYSIENFYCTPQVISNILKNEFFFDETDESFKAIKELFEKRQTEFHNCTKLFNLWYFSAKKKSDKLGIASKISLNEKFPKEFISISISNISSNYSLETIKEKFPDAIDVTEQDLKDNTIEFDSKPPSLRYRGKYQIEFMVKFLNFIIKDANTDKQILKTKTNFRIDPALILSQLSQYAETPSCLKEFVSQCA